MRVCSFIDCVLVVTLNVNGDEMMNVMERNNIWTDIFQMQYTYVLQRYDMLTISADSYQY